MPNKKGAPKGRGRGKKSKANRENQEVNEGTPAVVVAPQHEDEPAGEPVQTAEEDLRDDGSEQVPPPETGEQVGGGEIGDESAASSQASKSKKARVLSNLSEDEQEEVALFLERNDFIYNKRRTDHTSVSKKNKAWENLAREMGKEVIALKTFFESIRSQLGKLRNKKSGQEAVEITDRQQWIWTRFQFLAPHIGRVVQRTVQPFQNDPSTSQAEMSQENQDQTVVTTTTSTATSGSLTMTMSSTKKRRETGAETLEKELQTSKDRQEKLLQILQAPPAVEVPYPDRLKFGEYLGHAFQNLPQSIYRDTHKAIFDILYNAEKQAEQASVKSATEQATTTQQYQQWQPDPSQWQFRPIDPAQSVWHSQDTAWVNRQFPGYTPSPSQQELARQRSPQMPTFTTLMPVADSQSHRRFINDATSQEESPYSTSDTVMAIGPIAVATQVSETQSATPQLDKLTPPPQ